MMPKLREVSDALEAILEDRASEIVWKQAVLGPTYPKELTGYICCDKIEYSQVEKTGEPQATATFALQIISPNPKSDPTNTTMIEDYATKVKGVLDEERTLDGWALDSAVKSIQFATPAAVTNIGIAIIEFVVKIEE